MPQEDHAYAARAYQPRLKALRHGAPPYPSTLHHKAATPDPHLTPPNREGRPPGRVVTLGRRRMPPCKDSPSCDHISDSAVSVCAQGRQQTSEGRLVTSPGTGGISRGGYACRHGLLRMMTSAPMVAWTAHSRYKDQAMQSWTTHTPSPHAADEDAIRAIHQQMSDAWNTGSGAAENAWLQGCREKAMACMWRS